MPTPNFWVFLLPVLGGGVWGSEVYFDPKQMYYVGPSQNRVVGGVGQIFEAQHGHQEGLGEATFSYTYGYKFYGFQPKVTSFVTARGDVVTGIGLESEFVYDKFQLPGAGPWFFSWSAGPAFYRPAPGPGGNSGPPVQFQLVIETGFYVGKSLRVSFAYDHYSDGIHDNANPNGNAFTLNLGYRF